MEAKKENEENEIIKLASASQDAFAKDELVLWTINKKSGKIGNGGKSDGITPSIEILKIKTETYYALQKIRIQAQLRAGAFVRDERLSEIEAETLHVWTADLLMTSEKKIKKEVAELLIGVPIWEEFLNEVKGIGPCLGGSLYAAIFDISKFNYVSSLWKYAGMDVVDGEAPRRKRGEKITWNPFLRMTMYKVTDSFVKQKADVSLYRRLYDQKKAYYQGKYPEEVNHPTRKRKDGKPIKKYTPGHIHNMAKRYTGKIFLQHLWRTWRELENLEVTKPWILTHGGHNTYIEPEQSSEARKTC